MTISNFVEGITILRGFYKDRDGYHIGAEHDMVYLYATDRPLTAVAFQAMKDLGWWQQESGEDENYNPDASWGAFV